ncbi:MAG: F0F1 ATP synthase subunit A [Alphaproteobacteria bacterium]|nr:F0F1 ATP synthase subunit A [Alphaproteobacteria bacterium]NCQ66993.1 F0F1 ATP synthase subunit A [Alphaproteobacteria bacterium]NCT07590.1 F0F1 ATP synthase subunit A [Alphaproteobacteria bacterium]
MTTHSPMDQFRIHEIIPLELMGSNISITNATIWLAIVTVALITFQHFALRKATLVPNKLQLVLESAYDFIAGMLGDTVGKEGKAYAPFIFTLFMFILFANLFGMLPYSFTITSHFAVTLSLALLFFITITIIGFVRHGLHFFSLFLPAGAPKVLAPLLIVLELVSYLVRPFTLSLRLFLNMMAGHVILKVFAGFSVMVGMYFGIFPALFNVLFVGFEFFVAGLQAYIFTILVCIYLNDSVNLH